MKKIQILGTGCAKCNTLADNVRAAADSLGIAAEFEKVTEIKDIMAWGVMSTPALVIDGQVVSQGKALKVAEIANLLK
jgi:small redox-active disulfide protein 2